VDNTSNVTWDNHDGISDISALKDLTNLTTLYLGGNAISDISVLKNLTNLTHLSLSYNEISDISVLQYLPNLTLGPFDLDGNPVTSSESLSAFEQYRLDKNVTLTNYDAQYDIDRNVGKLFWFSDFGVAELSDYYHYGYSGLEAEYFCIEVTPGAKAGEDYKMGSYSDKWYIYADRDSFSALFDELKEYKADGKSVGVNFVCQIAPKHYDSGKATATLTYYDFQVSDTSSSRVFWK
jgi:hypothetical protein